jgi:uncharacterized protein YecE (DUF72 family)
MNESAPIPNKAAHFFCGTSNVTLPVPNKTHFPPEYQDKSRLAYYASLFNTVEVNSSFYKVPLQRTVERWATEVPQNFRFTFKLWRGITHEKGCLYDPAEVPRFFQAINGIGDRKGALLVQFPASVTSFFLPQLNVLLGQIADANKTGWHVAVELRDRSWYTDETYEVLEKHQAAVVKHDMPKSSTPLVDMEAAFVYLRYHGENGRYRGTYEADFLREHASYARDVVEDGKTVYAYFNNTMGEAVYNARDMQRYYAED